MAISSARKALFGIGVTSTVLCAGLTTLAVAQAAPRTTPAATGAAAAAVMPSAVEDFTYPGAAQILQEKGITLKRGDGHVMLTDCGSKYDVMVESRTGKNFFCFTISGKQGYLTMELPDAFAMWTKEHPVKATVTADGKTTVVDAPKNEYTSIGETTNSGKRSVLLELRAAG
ncbi:hypothetical protein [Streptomyces celluloflavus]|uniref:hypothetical protein n=1 Tax=Streptomyces celluloflavus TaxID=58344 RepID=UPI0036C7FFCC